MRSKILLTQGNVWGVLEMGSLRKKIFSLATIFIGFSITSPFVYATLPDITGTYSVTVTDS